MAKEEITYKDFIDWRIKHDLLVVPPEEIMAFIMYLKYEEARRKEV